MTARHSVLRSVAVLATLLSATAAATAATSITNPLTGFTGNSTQAPTQAALAAAGFNVTSTAGNDGENDPTINFDATGAHFGLNIPGDAGRNYVRTAAADYANYSFVAEVTWVTDVMFGQAAYFGLGSAEFGEFRIADWGTPNSAVQQFLEVDPLDPVVFTLKNKNGRAVFDDGTDAPGMDLGTARLRLTYDWFSKTANFAIDLNYAGGAFTADVVSPTVHTLDLYGPDGWSVEPAHIYFGGDDGTTYKDFSVTLSTPNMLLGDLNGSGTITTADWVVLRNNQNADLSALTLPQAYALGDLTGDKLNDHADFKLFKTMFEGAHGAGSFEAMLAAIPEPSTIAVALAAFVFSLPAARRARRHRSGRRLACHE
jgi:hypothetical protein